MGTTIRADISKNNKYWISKHRYYELKHFCMQYKEWVDAYNSIGYESKRFGYEPKLEANRKTSNNTERIAIIREGYHSKIKMLMDSASEADDFLADYILEAVTEGRSYEYLKMVMEIPCCREYYYERYRKFFWILNMKRC